MEILEHGGEASGNVSCATPILKSSFIGILYVGSIYIWKQSPERSSHPSVIRKRILSVTIVSLLTILYVYYFVDASLLKDHSLWTLLGFRWNGLLNAIILPLVLTTVLFLGPIVVDTFNNSLPFALERSCWSSRLKDILWIRNYIFSPISEEIVFRACVLVLIIHCMSPMKAVLVCPLFFGAAHLHHIFEQVRFGVNWRMAILTSTFQFCYTTIFGVYSGYLFLRTGHILAPILVHSFCNVMGFPDFLSVLEMGRVKRLVSLTTLFFGFSVWMSLIQPLTHPSLYQNTLPWNANI